MCNGRFFDYNVTKRKGARAVILVHTNDDLGYILTHAGPNEHIRLTAGTHRDETARFYEAPPVAGRAPWVKKTS